MAATNPCPTTPERSRIMARVRSTGNASTEQRMVAIFRAARITGWRRHLPLPGKPDFAFPKAKVVVFVDGCFWHGCPRCYRAPKQNAPYWTAKVARNKERDRRQARELRQKGWRVLRLWEHQLKNGGRTAARVASMIS